MFMGYSNLKSSGSGETGGSYDPPSGRHGEKNGLLRAEIPQLLGQKVWFPRMPIYQCLRSRSTQKPRRGNPMFSVGTKTLFVGAHQIFIHPVAVTLAWHDLYGAWPTWKEALCIFIHDWGYFGSPNIDGKEGEEHPRWAAEWAFRHLDGYPAGHRPTPGLSCHPYYNLCLFHSRSTAWRYGQEPSKLCWADKLALKYDPWWMYLPRAIMSGEIHEYRQRAANFGEVPLTTSNRDWYSWARARMMRKAYNKDTRPAYEGS